MTWASDEKRWREAGRPTEMTIEQRADYIADGWRNRDGRTWQRIRDRALDQLREVAAK